jgi:hypothetical protein
MANGPVRPMFSVKGETEPAGGIALVLNFTYHEQRNELVFLKRSRDPRHYPVDSRLQRTPGLFNARKYHCMSAGSGIFRVLGDVGFEAGNSFARETQSRE